MIDHIIAYHGIKIDLFRSMIEYWGLQTDMRELGYEITRRVKNGLPVDDIANELSEIEIRATIIRDKVDDTIARYGLDEGAG